MKLPLYKLISYVEATEEERSAVCNGCGAKDGISVPNTMWGLSIKEACENHDWMFDKGITWGDFIFSNAIFLYNLTTIIINGSNFITIMPRLYRAVKYYLAVVKWGEKAYWINKDKNENKNITFKGIFV